MVLGDGRAEAESHKVDQWDNLKNICDDEVDQSALIKSLAKHYHCFAHKRCQIASIFYSSV